MGKSNEMTELAEKTGLSKAVLWFYGVGDFGASTFSSMKQYFWVYFLSSVALFPLGVVAIITTATQVVTIALSPVYGAFIDATKPMRWGRYRSWVIIPLPFCIIFSALAWTHMGGHMAPFFCGLFTIIGTIFYNIAYVANQSLIRVVAKTQSDRARMASTRGVYANLSVVAWSVLGQPLIALIGTIVGTGVINYTVASFIYGCMFGIGYCIHFIITKDVERVLKEEGFDEEALENTAAEVKKSEDAEKREISFREALKKPEEEKVTVKEMLVAMIKVPSIFALFVPDIIRWFALFSMNGATVFFFTLVWNNAALMATYLAVANVAAIIGSVVMRVLATKVGLKNTAIIGFFGFGIPLIIGWLQYHNIMFVMVCLVVAKFFYGIIYTIVPALYADISVYSEWKTGHGAAGWFTGLSQVPIQIGILITNLVISGFLALGGYTGTETAETATPLLQDWIANVFMGVQGIAMVVTTFVFVFGYRLTTAVMQQCQKELAERS